MGIAIFNHQTQGELITPQLSALLSSPRTRDALSSSCLGTLFTQLQSLMHTKPILRFHSHALTCMLLAKRCGGTLVLRMAGGGP